jgi:hypothetical protein
MNCLPSSGGPSASPVTVPALSPASHLRTIRAVTAGVLYHPTPSSSQSGRWGAWAALAFPAGEGLTAHTTPSDALAYVLDGEAVV